jgi:hypothetical protein
VQIAAAAQVALSVAGMQSGIETVDELPSQPFSPGEAKPRTLLSLQAMKVLDEPTDVLMNGTTGEPEDIG